MTLDHIEAWLGRGQMVGSRYRWTHPRCACTLEHLPGGETTVSLRGHTMTISAHDELVAMLRLLRWGAPHGG